MIWVSSDFHFSHKNYCRGTSNWPDKSKCRDFNTLEEMNNTIISNINSVVKENDELWVLGDFCFSGVDSYKLRNKINCQNIHYVCGNHSNKHGQEYDPVMSCGNRVSSLFKSYGYYAEIFYKKARIILFHYPIASWNEMSSGSIMLHGHTHRCPEDRYVNGGKSMDVGLDGNDLFPYNLDTIMDIMKDRPIKREGHHA